MLKIAICDDEKYFRNELKEILENYLKDNGIRFEIDTFSSGKEFIELGIGMIKYEVVFLDINMDELDGLMTAKKIRENSKDIFVVFVTAFVNYTIEGYKVDAVRYILKSNHMLKESVYECMEAIQEKMNYTVTWKEFDFNEGHKKVSLEHLLYIESKLHKLDFYIMEDKLVKYSLYSTLDEVDAALAGNDFLRIHQSYLVNMKYIKHLRRYVVLLNNGIELSVPRARFKDVQEAITAYKGEV
ncbi:MAG: LytTR family DNA-binding domain-containing protein [Clostridium sp.]|nr:LytTR family DNA-binding domain-containing protein [Clostridium sp.]